MNPAPGKAGTELAQLEDIFIPAHLKQKVNEQLKDKLKGFLSK